jgi:hypothetical protein
MFVTERDLVQIRRVYHPFPDSNSYLMHFKSIEHSMCPVQSKFVRANTIISGYYLQELNSNPPSTLICTVSQTDIGGIIPKTVVNSLAAKAPKDWIMNLKAGLKIIKNKYTN